MNLHLIDKKQENNLELSELADRLQKAKRVLIITVAGCSADAGIPTYRGVGGLYNGLTSEGFKIEQAMHVQFLREMPDVSWRYLKELIGVRQSAIPHEGYFALSRMASRFDSCKIFTQNVDGLHEKSGYSAFELHGSGDELSCLNCGKSIKTPPVDELKIPCFCQFCSGTMKPDIVMFGEGLPSKEMRELTYTLHDGVDVVLAIGTKASFPYIAYPFIMAKREGKFTAEITMDNTGITHIVDCSIRMRAVDALVALEKML